MHDIDPDDDTRTHFPLINDTIVGHYRIIEKIGAGGMGEVFLAEDTSLNRKVALKFLPVHLCRDANCRARFKREAQAVAKLSHPNIITIFEVGEFQSRPFFAMEYVEGQSFRVLGKDGELPLNRVVDLAIQVCEGLARAHASGIVHRDVKSSNILIDLDGRVKIVDFGLALVRGDEHLTKTGSTLGTLGYSSPEQVRGEQVDARSDLFSFGVVLYDLIAGRSPFKRDNDAAMLHAILSEQPEPLARYKASVPADLQQLVTRCLAKDPSERYQSAQDLLADLRVIERLLVSGPGGVILGEAPLQPSIAVLPFANMSADPENEYFSDGLTEELLNVLAKNPELKVTGRTSSFAFKGKREDLRSIGQKLGVGTLLEGSVRKAGNRVRITAQLVNATDGFHVWSETYERVLDDIFAVQDNIAEAVATAMKVKLLFQSAKKRSVNPESYALVLRARQSAIQTTKVGLKVASDLYGQAIALDPDNASAWAGLARVLVTQISMGHVDRGSGYHRAKEAAQKAIELDNTLPDAHHALGGIYSALEQRLAEAGVEYRKAYELAPNDCRCLSGLSLFEGYLGHFEEALRLRRKALALDPMNPSIHFGEGRLLMWAGRLNEAREAICRALELSPDFTSAHLNLSWVALLQGDAEEALSLAQKESSEGYRSCGVAMAYHALRRRKDSDQALDEFLKCGERWAFQYACVYAHRGERDKAFEWLEKGTAIHDTGILQSIVSPWLKSLHADPQWPAFLNKIGLDK